MTRTPRPLSERDYDVLGALAAFHDNMARIGSPDQGARPMDVGGGDASHHCATLRKLERRALVRSATKWSKLERRNGGPRLYWITDAGQAALKAWREAQLHHQPSHAGNTNVAFMTREEHARGLRDPGAQGWQDPPLGIHHRDRTGEDQA